MKRKIETFLLNWKNNPDHLPLIVKGARQIGKTYSILKFAKENYENVVTINFSTNKEYLSIFDNGFEVDNIIKNISLINSKFKFIKNKTLIFFDEIQLCAKGMTSLKNNFIFN